MLQTTPSITQLPAVEQQPLKKKPADIFSPESFCAGQVRQQHALATQKMVKPHPAILLASKHTFSSKQRAKSKSQSPERNRSNSKSSKHHSPIIPQSLTKITKTSIDFYEDTFNPSKCADIQLPPAEETLVP